MLRKDFIYSIIVVLFISVVFKIIHKIYIEPYSNSEINSYNLENIPKYLINLDRRKDRLITTKKLLGDFGYNNTIRYPAIDGQKITNTELVEMVHPDSLEPIYKKQRQNHDELSIGAVGCYLSHVNLWDDIENSDKEEAIIFEDDTKPTIANDELEKILASCPSDWDVILFGGYYNIKDDFKNDQFHKVNQFFCLHAYMINKGGIKKIKPHLKPIKVQIDWVLSNLSKDNKLNVYVIKNSKWYQNTKINSTDIQTPMVK